VSPSAFVTPRMTTNIVQPNKHLVDTGVMAIVRGARPERITEVADVLVRSGITCLELTFTIPSMVGLLSQLRSQLPAHVAIGAGTVTSIEQATLALDAGAMFLVSPSISLPLLELTRDRRVEYYPGAATPTEVLLAWQMGASAVKLFPAAMWGPSYLQHLQGPFPDIAIIPTGGIGINDAANYIAAGARAVGVGGPLLGDALSGGSLFCLAQRAEMLLKAVADARRQRP